MFPDMACSGVAIASNSDDDVINTNSNESGSGGGNVSLRLAQNPRQSRRAKRPATSAPISSPPSTINLSSYTTNSDSSGVVKSDSVKVKKHQSDENHNSSHNSNHNHHVHVNGNSHSHGHGQGHSHSHSHSRNSSHDSGASAHLNIPLPPIPLQSNSILTPPNASNGFKNSLHVDPLLRSPSKSAPATPPDSPVKETPSEIQLTPKEIPSPESSDASESPVLTPKSKPIPPLLNSINISNLAFETPYNIPLISARTLVSAIDYHYSQPLPDVDTVFPWMHGLHPNNLCQRAFLDPLKRYRDSSGIYFDLSQANEDLLDDSTIFKPPSDIRGLMIVKVGDEANVYGTLVGTVTPDEILTRKENNEFDNEWKEYNESIMGDKIKVQTFAAQEVRKKVIDEHSLSVSDSEEDGEHLIDKVDIEERDSEEDNIEEGVAAPAQAPAPAPTSTPPPIPLPKSTSSTPSDSDIDMIDESEEPLYNGKFLYLDPPEGISLRNFQIQVAKWATFSDICVYSPNPKDINYAKKIALLIAEAQNNFKISNPNITNDYKTFICDATVDEILYIAPHAVSIPSQSHILDEEEIRLKNWDSNFLFHERVEMSMMSSASPIGSIDTKGGGVWLGNTVDFETYIDMCHSPSSLSSVDDSIKARNWATFIECFEGPQLPPFQILDQYINEAESILESTTNNTPLNTTLTPLSIQFPSSGSIPLSECNDEVFLAIVSLCKLLYLRSKVPYRDNRAGVLIYCNDGYTETSLLALAYIIYSTGVSSSQAWIDLHVKYNRPFFCFTVDVLVIMALEKTLLEYSPAIPTSKFYSNNGAIYKQITSNFQLSNDISPWFVKLDGSLPSKILPHMYLGSLHHAENPEMLVKLGIQRVLSVGESLTWMNYDNTTNGGASGSIFDNPYNGITKVMYMDNIQDDGVDALTNSLSSCLQFIDEGYKLGEPTLVHCRVGVSRSATVCIAEVMKRLSVGLPRAYLFVRVRRLNVIIQPNLRFMYELVKWEEINRQNGEGWLREVDWHVLCREIAIINKVYIS